MAKRQFPAKLFVTREYDSNDPDASWLNAAETVDGEEDGQEVAIYALIERRTLKVTRELMKR